MADVFLYGGELNPADVRLRDPSTSSGFPAQILGLRAYYGSAVHDLCMVAAVNAPTGMGGAIMLDKNGTVLAVYLVETSDPNASPIRVRTTTGTKAIRVRT